ncbi:hypothetical protein D3C72_1213260 [compost metagenome]
MSGALSSGLGSPLDIALDDTAVRASALDRFQINAVLGGDATGQGRGENALAVVRLRRGRRRSDRCSSLGRFSRSGLSLRSFSLGGGRRRGRAAFILQAGDRGVDLHAFSAFGDQDVGDFAFIDGLDLHRGLVSLDLGDHVAGGDNIPDLDVPLGQNALLHGRRQGRHQDVGHLAVSASAACATWACDLSQLSHIALNATARSRP